MIKALFLGWILLFCCGCSQKPERPARAFPVTIGETLKEDVPRFIKGVGQLEASLEAYIKAQVGGILTNVLFTDGQLVEEGDLLMTIDPRTYEAHLQEAQAQLAEDQAKLHYAQDVAETFGTLVGKDYVSRLEYDQALKDVAVYKAAIELDNALIQIASIDLGYTQLTAPFKGYTGLRKYDPGNYIDPAADQPLVVVRKITPMTVRFYLPAEYVPEIRMHQKEEPLFLEAVLPSDPAHTLQGTLWFIDNQVNKETGMILLKGTLPNEDERGWPGEFVRVYLRLSTLKNAVLVPKRAVVLGQQGHHVFILDEETKSVQMRLIGKGFVYKEYFVALWGLEGGEKVVTDGQLNLYDGALVFY